MNKSQRMEDVNGCSKTEGKMVSIVQWMPGEVFLTEEFPKRFGSRLGNRSENLFMETVKNINLHISAASQYGDIQIFPLRIL